MIPQDEGMKNFTTEEILHMIDKEINSKEFLERIENGLYGEYIPNDTDTLVYFKPVEYYMSIPLAACIKIECVYLEEDTAYVQYTILDNPIGKFVYDNLKSGKIPCFLISNTLYVDEEANKVIGIYINGINIAAFLDEEEIVEMV